MPLRAFAVLAAMLVVRVPADVAAQEPPEGTVEVVLSTTMGDIVLSLFPDKAPKTVANFLAYVDGGYYDGGTFYRVVRHDNDNGNPKIRVIQGGAAMDGSPPFPPVAHETTDETGILHLDATVSMARGDPGTATHAIFITIGAQPALDAGEARNADRQGFAAFGRVIEGMEVVRAINAITATADTEGPYMKGQILADPVVINGARRR